MAEVKVQEVDPVPVKVKEFTLTLSEEEARAVTSGLEKAFGHTRLVPNYGPGYSNWREENYPEREAGLEVMKTLQLAMAKKQSETKSERETGEVLVAIDASGSTDQRASADFISFAKQIPNAKLVNFSDSVYEYDDPGPIRGMGGTSYQAIEDFILSSLPEYPSRVIVLTDGDSMPFDQPKYPDRWTFVLRHWKGEEFTEMERFTKRHPFGQAIDFQAAEPAKI